jgi:hypothetical protein
MAGIKPPYQYVLDSSALFDLRKMYPQHIFPGLWDRFNEMCNQKQIVSTREVFREIKKGNDELIPWAEQFEEIFLEPCEDELIITADILKYYPDNILAKYSTRPWADPLVVSCAKYYSLPIIQHEVVDANQFKIPPIAKKVGVSCLRLTDFFQDEGWQFN